MRVSPVRDIERVSYSDSAVAKPLDLSLGVRGRVKTTEEGKTAEVKPPDANDTNKEASDTGGKRQRPRVQLNAQTDASVPQNERESPPKCTCAADTRGGPSENREGSQHSESQLNHLDKTARTSHICSEHIPKWIKCGADGFCQSRKISDNHNEPGKEVARDWSTANELEQFRFQRNSKGTDFEYSPFVTFEGSYVKFLNIQLPDSCPLSRRQSRGENERTSVTPLHVHGQEAICAAGPNMAQGRNSMNICCLCFSLAWVEGEKDINTDTVESR